MKTFQTHWRSVVAGICGMALFFVAWHLWQDHANLHALVNLVNAAQAAKATK